MEEEEEEEERELTGRPQIWEVIGRIMNDAAATGQGR
jgi:hypothetical protein